MLNRLYIYNYPGEIKTHIYREKDTYRRESLVKTEAEIGVTHAQNQENPAATRNQRRQERILP